MLDKIKVIKNESECNGGKRKALDGRLVIWWSEQHFRIPFIHAFISLRNAVFFSPLHINVLPSVCRWNASIRAADLSETLYSEFSFTREPFRPTASCFRKTTWSMLTKVSDGPSDLYWCNDPFRTIEVIWSCVDILVFQFQMPDFQIMGKWS